MKSMMIWMVLVLHALVLVGCYNSDDWEESEDGEGADADVDGDSDADADTDADGDSDVDSDVDGDSDTDSDSDTDGDADGDSDTDSDADADCSCSDPEQPCCHADGCHYEKEDVVCDEEHLVEYSCPDNNAVCGATMLVRRQEQLCSGNAYGCFGETTDWGEWEEATDEDHKCEAFETCQEVEPEEDGDESEAQCVTAHDKCPVDFGNQICFVGDKMPDCESTDCSADPITMDLTETLLSVGEGKPGEAVILTITTVKRGTLLVISKPMNDIVATLSHNGKTADFYNKYNGIEKALAIPPGYILPTEWNLPHFFGEDMYGEWKLHFEDHGMSGDPSGMLPLNVTEWCLTFVDPETTDDSTTTGEWLSPAKGQIFGAFTTDPSETAFQFMIRDYVRIGNTAPVLYLDTAHNSTSEDMSIALITANGTTYPIKEMDVGTIPYETELTGLMGTWLTGRYQLNVANRSSLDGRIENWSINVGVADLDIDGDSDTDTDTDTDSDTD